MYCTGVAAACGLAPPLAIAPGSLATRTDTTVNLLTGQTVCSRCALASHAYRSAAHARLFPPRGRFSAGKKHRASDRSRRLGLRDYRGTRHAARSKVAIFARSNVFSRRGKSRLAAHLISRRQHRAAPQAAEKSPFRSSPPLARADTTADVRRSFRASGASRARTSHVPRERGDAFHG